MRSLVRERQSVQLDSLALHLRERAMALLEPALGGREPRREEARFLVLYRLLYWLACGDGRRGVTITRDAPPPQAGSHILRGEASKMFRTFRVGMLSNTFQT